MGMRLLCLCGLRFVPTVWQNPWSPCEPLMRLAICYALTFTYQGKMPFAAFPSPHHPITLFFAPWRKNKFGTKIEILASTTLTYSPCSSDKSIVASSPHSTFVFVTKNKFPLLLSRTFTTCSCACLRHESISFTESDLCWLLLRTYHLYNLHSCRLYCHSKFSCCVVTEGESVTLVSVH